jgi:hypothetical protein
LLFLQFPFGKIPALEAASGLNLSEANAIMAYREPRLPQPLHHQTPLLPTGESNLLFLSSHEETQVIPVQIIYVDRLFLERGCSSISEPSHHPSPLPCFCRTFSPPRPLIADISLICSALAL